jgi:tetratricopeptide (TPR) repeat protein
MRAARSSRLGVAAVVLAGAALILFASLLCVQAFAEHELQETNRIQGLQRAARLQPLNAETEATIGSALLSAVYGDPAGAAEHLRRSVALNPHDSRAWRSLADAYDQLGDDTRRDYAIRQALAAEPHDTEVQWEAANLFLNTDLDGSLRLFRDVIQQNDRYAPAAIQVAYNASGGDVEKTMLAVPSATSSRLLLIKWLLQNDHLEAADRVWPTVVTADGDLRPRDTFFYFDSLIERHQLKQATAVWSGLVQKNGALRAGASSGDLVNNGDFETELSNGGFGWRYAQTAGVLATLDTSAFHSGTRSLALQLDAENLAECGLTELMPVEPGARYRLSAWAHAEELEAAHGIRVAVRDAYSNADLLLSDEMVGSFPWREVGGDFEVPPGTELVKIAFVRSPTNGIIRGRLWLDDVRMEKK